MSETQDTIQDSELLPYKFLFAQNFGPIPGYKIQNQFLDLNFDDIFEDENARKRAENLAKYIPEYLNFKSSFLGLDYKYRLEVMSKIKNSGLLDLIEQIGRNTGVFKIKIF